MKSFEHVIKQRFMSILDLDQHQFAYRQNRSTKDAFISLDHILRKHLEQPKSYARVLFVDFSSAFNTILPHILAERLSNQGVPVIFTKLIVSFLSNRTQRVHIGDHKSSNLESSTGCPQGCVLSPLLFSIYTDAIRSQHPNVHILKYADDMAIVGL